MRVQTTSEFTLWDQPLPGMGDPLLSDSMGLFHSFETRFDLTGESETQSI